MLQENFSQYHKIAIRVAFSTGWLHFLMKASICHSHGENEPDLV